MQGCRVQGCGDSGMQGCGDSGMQGAGMWGFRDAGCRHVGIQGCRDAEVWGFKDAGCSVAGVQGARQEPGSSSSIPAACAPHGLQRELLALAVSPSGISGMILAGGSSSGETEAPQGGTG